MNTRPNTARRALSLLALLLALLAVAGCTPKNNAPVPATAATAAPGTGTGTEAATNETRPTGTARTAVVCFSRTDHTWQVAPRWTRTTPRP